MNAFPAHLCWTIHPAPLGPLVLARHGEHLVYVGFAKDQAEEAELRKDFPKTRTLIRDDSGFDAIRGELNAYFAGTLKAFTCPLETFGTTFQTGVWQALRDIPYGSTASYQDVAVKVGNYKATRAVGLANNRNRLAIVIPCHRVVGKNGSLVGYAGGLSYKSFLLEHEANTLA